MDAKISFDDERIPANSLLRAGNKKAMHFPGWERPWGIKTTRTKPKEIPDKSVNTREIYNTPLIKGAYFSVF